MRKDIAIYISIGVILYLLFGVALFYSGSFWLDVLDRRPVVMGWEIAAERSVVEASEEALYGDYRVMRGVSKGELNQSVGDRFYLSWPVKDDLGIVTQCFSENHEAIDIAHYTYPKILAVADGVVLKAGCLESECPEGTDEEDAVGLARTVLIKHENGLISLYGHLKTIAVEEGQNVTRGDEIGEMGKSGDTISISESGEGVHLHFALLLNDDWVAINPAPYFREDFCNDGNPDPEAYYDPVDDTVYDDFDYEKEFSEAASVLSEPELEQFEEESNEDDLDDNFIRIDTGMKEEEAQNDQSGNSDVEEIPPPE